VAEDGNVFWVCACGASATSGDYHMHDFYPEGREQTQLEKLRNENEFLRAMLGRCIKCGRTTREHSVEFEVYLGETGPRYHSMVWFGGGASGGGATKQAALVDAYGHMLSWMTREGQQAMTKPWHTIGGSFSARRRRRRRRRE